MLLFAVVVSPAQATGWTWPVTGEILSDYRNGDDPYASGQHRGIDIAAAVGHPVVAATDGTVAFAGAAGLSGLTVSVRTGDGRFDTSYLHLAEAEVRRGDRVTAGERIGAVGTSGRRSVEAPHLHFGVRDAGTDHGYRNPLDFLPAPLPPAGEPQPPPLPVPLPVPVPPAPAPEKRATESEAVDAVRRLVEVGARPRPAASIVAELTGERANRLYRALTTERDGTDTGQHG